jgi:hypothetical protein
MYKWLHIPLRKSKRKRSLKRCQGATGIALRLEGQGEEYQYPDRTSVVTFCFGLLQQRPEQFFGMTQVASSIGGEALLSTPGNEQLCQCDRFAYS